MPTGQLTHFESDGKSVEVDLLYTVANMQVAYIEGWLGITVESGDSGNRIALNVDDREYQFSVPSSLSVSKGQIVYVEVADLTGHTPDDSAYSTSSGAGKRALFRATMDKDGNNVVTGKMLSGHAV